MECRNIIGNGGGSGGSPISGVQGGQVFDFIDTDFTPDGGDFYVDIVHGYTDVIMELQADLGSGLVLGSGRVNDDTPGTRRLWMSVLPDAAQVKIVGLS